MTTDSFDSAMWGSGTLRTCDVGSLRAARLRQQCHTRLHTGDAEDNDALDTHSRWRTATPPAGAGWCAMYLVEVVRRTVGFYWF
jgi:hypothetical protein